jgi:hypothetical protein
MTCIGSAPLGLPGHVEFRWVEGSLPSSDAGDACGTSADPARRGTCPEHEEDLATRGRT